MFNRLKTVPSKAAVNWQILAVGLLIATKLSFGAESIEPNINASERELIDWLELREDEMASLLERLTNINSGSLNKRGLAEVASLFETELVSLGFATETLPGDLVDMPSCPGSNYDIDLADHLLAKKSGTGSRLLLMGHLDTVFRLDSTFQSYREDGDRVLGPGVSDMKGGLVVMLYALKALHAQGVLDDMAITVLLNSDEEMGSLSSRKYLEEQARIHDYGLVYESSGNNTLVRERKGLGQARFVVSGRASHAGGAHEQGRSAIKELAYKIVEIEKLTDYESGVTVNVGIVSGGVSRNTIAPCAEGLIDLRYPTPEQGEEAARQFENVFNQVYSYPVDTGELSTNSWVNLHRPPKLATPASDQLLEKTRAIGRLLGQELGVIDSGGGTDGSLTQAVGLPTLDSLGIAGTGAHTIREEGRLSSLLERAQLSAVLISRLAAE